MCCALPAASALLNTWPLHAQAIAFLHPDGPEAAAAEEDMEAAKLAHSAAAALAVPCNGPGRLGKAASLAVRLLPPAACASIGEASAAAASLQAGVSTPNTPASALQTLPSALGPAQRSGSIPDMMLGAPEADDFQVMRVLFASQHQALTTKLQPGFKLPSCCGMQAGNARQSHFLGRLPVIRLPFVAV